MVAQALRRPEDRRLQIRLRRGHCLATEPRSPFPIYATSNGPSHLALPLFYPTARFRVSNSINAPRSSASRRTI